MLSIIAITDEPLVEMGIRCLCAESPEFQLLDVCRNTAALIQAVGKHDPELVICGLRGDHDIPLADLRHASPRSAIVVYSREFSPEFAHHALEAGIRGLITSTADIDTLKDCLRRTARGELWLEQSLSMMLLDTRPIRLSKRQAELVRLLAQGLKNKEIASVLGISEGTVKSYLTALFEKVGAKDRFELALYGLKHLSALGSEPALQRRPLRTFAPPRTEKVSVA